MRREPNRFEDAEAVRRRRAVQSADRLRVQLQATMQAAVEAGEDIPAKVNEAVLALDRWCRMVAHLPSEGQPESQQDGQPEGQP